VLVTMWTWITGSRAGRDRVRIEVPAPLLRRDADELGDWVCLGSADHCAELLSRYADAGCQRGYLWPLGDEPRQIELAAEIAPSIRCLHKGRTRATFRAQRKISRNRGRFTRRKQSRGGVPEGCEFPVTAHPAHSPVSRR
jgi:hypothetical protein